MVISSYLFLEARGNTVQIDDVIMAFLAWGNSRRTFAGVSSSLFRRSRGKCAHEQYLHKIARLPTQDGRNSFSWSADRESRLPLAQLCVNLTFRTCIFRSPSAIGLRYFRKEFICDRTSGCYEENTWKAIGLLNFRFKKKKDVYKVYKYIQHNINILKWFT